MIGDIAPDANVTRPTRYRRGKNKLGPVVGAHTIASLYLGAYFAAFVRRSPRSAERALSWVKRGLDADTGVKQPDIPVKHPQNAARNRVPT